MWRRRLLIASVVLLALIQGFSFGRAYERDYGAHTFIIEPASTGAAIYRHDQAWSPTDPGVMALGVVTEGRPTSVPIAGVPSLGVVSAEWYPRVGTVGDAAVIRMDRDGYVLARCVGDAERLADAEVLHRFHVDGGQLPIAITLDGYVWAKCVKGEGDR